MNSKCGLLLSMICLTINLSSCKDENLKPINGVENGYEYTDLGLSVRWANCNIGAQTPEEYGFYFAWGEVEAKNVYEWSSYVYYDSEKKTLTKYCVDGKNGFLDNKKELELQDDAAHITLGGKWRMATYAEILELREKCTWELTMEKGVKGYKIVGPNGNSIFLPAAGYMFGDNNVAAQGTFAYSWSNSLDEANSEKAYGLCFNALGVDWEGDYRYYGHTIRPVLP